MRNEQCLSKHVLFILYSYLAGCVDGVNQIIPGSVEWTMEMTVNSSQIFFRKCGAGYENCSRYKESTNLI
jgi:hypothetical protein